MATVGALAPLIRYVVMDNGQVAPGAKAYFYESGTTTPQAVYTDAGLTTPHTNPVIADADGVLPVIYFAAANYRVLITTSTGVTIYPATDDIYDFGETLAGVPAGAMMPYGGTAAPTGFVFCDGSAVSRTSYAALFTAIGTTYGAGDGVTTFNVPDLRQRFPLGKAASGTGSILAATGGAIDHTHTYTQVLNHTHTVTVTDPGHTHTQASHGHSVTVTDPGHYHTGAPWASYRNDLNTNGNGDAVTGNVTGNTDTATTGISVSVGSTTATNNSNTTGITASTANPSGGVSSGTTASNNPPYVVVNYIIKT